MHQPSFRLLTFLALLFLSSPSWAISNFLDKWRKQYNKSSSGDINCQLCHINREGGSPWNAYGRQLRNIFLDLDVSTRTIEQAFIFSENLNADEDTPALTNLQEISANTQPGWKSGQTNIAYGRNDAIVGMFFPPTTIDPYPEKIEVTAPDFELKLIADGLTSPVAGVVAPNLNAPSLLFVVDQVGLVWRVNVDTAERTLFLDLQSRLVELGAFSTGGYDERGLLGFAFHPDFSENGRVYSYTSQPVNDTPDFSTLSALGTPDHQSVVTEHTLNSADLIQGKASIHYERELLRIDQPQFNHNGGDLQFDSSGYLYISLGDGGGADDQGIGHPGNGNGADPSNPLGAILRIDPLGNSSENGNYGIPPSNPFISNANRLDEIYAFGFRNPWKMSFDSNNDLYVADVGQNDIEEVNMVQAGRHYGWPFREGSFFFDDNEALSGLVTREVPDNLPNEELKDPVFEYDHDEGISIAGAQLYRGTERPNSRGKLIIADFQKRLFMGNKNSGTLSVLNISPDIFIYSLARDQNNEQYIMGNTSAQTSGSTGRVYKLQTTKTDTDELCLPIKVRSGSFSVVCL